MIISIEKETLEMLFYFGRMRKILVILILLLQFYLYYKWLSYEEKSKKAQEIPHWDVPAESLPVEEDSLQ